MARGGKRPGAGRKRGIPNRVTAEFKQLAVELGKEGASPLDLMPSVMRDESAPMAMRLDAAKAAAPYLHPRLNAVELSGSLHMTHEQALVELGAD